MTERWSKWFATGVSSKEAKSLKKKKKIIGEETRLIKVVFKEADRHVGRLNRNYQA